MKNNQIINKAKYVLRAEANSILQIIESLDIEFVQAVKLILRCKGRIIVIGIGKSGLVGKKIAATLASTGTPSFFIHATDAAHGDLGMIKKDDIVLAISKSGETSEIMVVIPLIKRLGVKLIAMCGNPHSSLAENADIKLNVFVKEEACPLGLAPTSSTTATLALGDALALTILDCRGFSAEDFARTHPSGTLGKKLLMRLKDIMRTGDAIPIVSIDSKLTDAILEMTNKRLGMTAVVEKDKTLVGVFTDGDLRRCFDIYDNLTEIRIEDVMTRNPVYLQSSQLAEYALHIIEKNKINSIMIVCEDKKIIGAVGMVDLVKLKII